MLLGALSGAAAGAASFVFLTLLEDVTRFREEHGWIVWLLPLAGLVVGATFHHVGGRAVGGTALAVREAREYRCGAPARMAPLVLAGTLVGHLFGASLGREGTGVQMSSSLTDAGARLLRLDDDHRAQLARASLAGGFASVFGVPVAGIAFAVEVARRRPLRALPAVVPAAFVGHLTARALGVRHHPMPVVRIHMAPSTVLALVVAGVAFGLTGRGFAWLVPRVKQAAHVIPWPPLRTAVGGAATVALVLLVGRDHLGLSEHLLVRALGGDHLEWWDPALKVLFTAIALGTGFVGGEVTPLLVVGATLGSVLAAPLGLPAAAVAALGLAAVFGAAAKVPIACAVMAVELFGRHITVAAVATCLIARALSPREGIYDHPAVSADDRSPTG